MNWEKLPVRIATEAESWPLSVDDKLPLAAINSFGLSGANAHLVIQGYDGPSEKSSEVDGKGWPAGALRQVETDRVSDTASGIGFKERPARLLPLSAKSPEALQDLATLYLSWLDENSDVISGDSTAAGATLSDMSLTAGVGPQSF